VTPNDRVHDLARTAGDLSVEATGGSASLEQVFLDCGAVNNPTIDADNGDGKRSGLLLDRASGEWPCLFGAP